MVTSSVRSPRFCVSQARECLGLIPVLVYRRGLCRLPEHPHSYVELCVRLRERRQWDSDLSFPTEPVTCEAHPYSVQFPLYFYGLVNGIHCEASARSREAESGQAHY
ncbi:hypothetical protein Taro_018734 [Colocasia esculenta]|uniref:Uncharacterized protein n=1 Tax=Colocasia esculenta TaxID=4460 RepID=A0A843UUQ0_COLES|nr:hypothetical protein [Colocasia esculenta]